MASAEREAEQAAEEQQAAQLPDELVELVVARLPHSEQPAVRLVSKAFEAAVDVRAVQLSEWPGEIGSSEPLRVRPSLQRHLERVELPGSWELRAARWRLLGKLVSQLPALRWLRVGDDCRTRAVPVAVAAAFSRLVRLDLPVQSKALPEGVTLPALRVASFCRAKGLSRISALAPQLRQLQLRSLYLTANSADTGSLPHVTHYSGELIRITEAGSAQAAGAALAAALPAVAVLVSLPTVFVTGSGVPLRLADLLAALPLVRAVRSGAWVLRLDGGPSASQGALSRLQHLSLHNPFGSSESSVAVCRWLPAAAPQLSGLRHVVMLLQRYDLRAAPDRDNCVLQLLCGLAALPALQSLVLPDYALCRECCVSAAGSSAGLHAALAALAGSPSLTRLEFAEIDGFGFVCTHPPQQRAEGHTAVRAAAAARAAPLALCFGQRHKGGVGLRHDAFGELAGGVFAAPVDEGSVWGELGPRAGQL